jgi:cytochrome c biogenesis protein CcdA
LLYAAPGAFALLFAGPALYMSELDPIVREQLESKKHQLQHWSTMYSLGFRTMPFVVLLGTGTAAAAFYKTRENYWIYGALALFSIIPYTFLAIMPTNNELNGVLAESKGEIEESKVSSVVEGMKRWTKLHRVRGLLALGAAGLFFVARQLSKGSS